MLKVAHQFAVIQMPSVMILSGHVGTEKFSTEVGLGTRQCTPFLVSHKSCAVRVTDLLNEAHDSDYVKLF
jgi:hypothetical protein